MRIGYGRVSTAEQNIAGQVAELRILGVDADQIHVDHGMSGRTRRRPALAVALGKLRPGDELVVTKLDRLGRSLRDLLDIADEIRAAGAALTVGRTTYDPADPIGQMLFQVLGMVSEFEVAMNRERTREGVARAKAAGKYKGRAPKLGDRQVAMLRKMHASGDYTGAEIAATFGITRSTLYRYLRKAT